MLSSRDDRAQRIKVINIWKENLAKGIARYCKAEGRKIEAEGRILGFERKTWFHISHGDRIPNEIEYLAKLYQETKIPEADPRKVPPDDNGKPRAWSEEKWRMWLNNPTMPGKKVIMQFKPAMASKTHPVIGEQVFTISELKKLKVEDFAQLIHDKQIGKSVVSVPVLLGELLRLFEQSGKSVRDREEIARNLDPEVAKIVLQYLDAYLHSSERREEELTLMEATRGIKT